MTVAFLSGTLILAAWFLCSLAPPALYPASRIQAGCFILLAVFLVSGRMAARAKQAPSHLALSCIPWILVLCLSAVMGPDPGRGFAPLWDWTLAAAAGLAVAQGLNPEGRRFLVRMIPCLAVIISLLGYHQIFSGFESLGQQWERIQQEIPDPAFRRDLLRRVADRRAFGPFLLPGIFGCFSGMGLFLAWDSFRMAARPGTKILWGFAIIFLLGGLLASGSISSVAALSLTLALGLLWIPKKRSLMGKPLILVAATAALAILPVFVRGWPAFMKESIMARLGLWRECLETMTGSYFFGVGTGRLGDVLGGASASEYFAHDAHSFAIQAAVECGLVGIAAGIWLALGVLRMARHLSRTGMTGHGLALIFTFSQSLVDLSLSQGEILLFFFLIWGLAEGQYPQKSRKKPIFSKRISAPRIGAGEVLVLSAGAAPLLFSNPRALPVAALWFALVSCFCLQNLVRAKMGMAGRLALGALLWALLSAMVQGTAGSGISGLAFAGLCLLLLGLTSTSVSDSDWKKRHRLFGWSAAVSAFILGFWAVLGSVSQGFSRNSGLFENPNLMAAGLLLGLLYTCERIRNGSKAERIIAGLFLTMILLGLLASGSRSALLCLALGAGLALFSRRSWAVAGFAGFLGLVVLLSVPSFRRAGDQYSGFRPKIWASAISAISSEWILGAGPGQGYLLLQTQAPPDEVGPFHYDHKPRVPHSSLLRVGVEAGWPALVLALLSWGILCRTGWFLGRRGRRPQGWWFLPLGILVQGLFAMVEETFISPGVLASFSVSAGLLLAQGSGKKSAMRKQVREPLLEPGRWIRIVSLLLVAAGPTLVRSFEGGLRATPLDPSSPDFWRRSAWRDAEIYLRSEKQKILPVLQKSLMAHDKGKLLAPRDPRVLLQRARLRGAAVGRGHLNASNLDLVWKDYSEAAFLGPRDALIPWEAAVQAYAFGRKDLALEWAGKSMVIEPNFAAPWELAAFISSGTDPEASVRYGEKAAQIRRMLASYRPENFLCERMVRETFPPTRF